MRIAAIVMVLVLVGCKSGKEDKVISENLTQVQNGVYQVCSYDAADGVSFKEYVFVNDTYILEGGSAYVGSGCSGTELYNMKMHYSLQSLGSHNYRLRIEGATVTAVDSAVAGEFSTMDFCGITSWTTGTPYSIVGRDCGGDGETFSIGDEQDITAGMLGSRLRVVSEGNKFTYTSLNAVNFANTSQSLVAGQYVYYDGTNGMHLDIKSAGTQFDATIYDQTLKRYFLVSGTISGSGNNKTFTVTGTTPSCPAADIDYTFAQTTFSLALREDGEPDLLLEKVSITAPQFRSAYLEAGYSSSCF